MTPAKRLMDVLLALILVVILSPLIVAVAVAILVIDGRPIFYLSERMKTPDTSFCLWKFRTMRNTGDDGGVSAGYKRNRITPLGAWLRRQRLDELPQLINILRGDMSFVGPRPPLRRYVELRPELYAKVLRNRPGVTGLATLIYHRTEERLLRACDTREATEDTYVRRCIPVKARLDLIWARHSNTCYDLRLIWRTLIRAFTQLKRHS